MGDSMRRIAYLGGIVGAGLLLTVAACGGPGSGAAAPTGNRSAATRESAPVSSRDAGAPAGASAGPAGNQAPDRCHAGGLRGELELFSPPGQAGSEQDAGLGLTNTTNRK